MVRRRRRKKNKRMKISTWDHQGEGGQPKMYWHGHGGLTNTILSPSSSSSPLLPLLSLLPTSGVDRALCSPLPMGMTPPSVPPRILRGIIMPPVRSASSLIIISACAPGRDAFAMKLRLGCAVPKRDGLVHAPCEAALLARDGLQGECRAEEKGGKTVKQSDGWIKDRGLGQHPKQCGILLFASFLPRLSLHIVHAGCELCLMSQDQPPCSSRCSSAGTVAKRSKRDGPAGNFETI